MATRWSVAIALSMVLVSVACSHPSHPLAVRSAPRRIVASPSLTTGTTRRARTSLRCQTTSLLPAADTRGPGPRVRLVCGLPGPTFQLLNDGASIAALLHLGSGDHIAMLSSHATAVRATRVVPGAYAMASAGGSLWVSRGGLPNTKSAPGFALIERFDPSTLAPRGTIRLPGRPRELAAGPAGLWVASGHRLYLLDPSTGHVRRSVPVSGYVERLAVDPTGELMYDTTYKPPLGNVVLAVEERNSRTGALIVRNTQGVRGLLTVNAVSPEPGGVWVSFSTGMLGGATLFSSSDLHRLAFWHPMRREGGSNATAAFASTGALWVLDGQAETISCADPRTGATRAVTRTGVNLTGNIAIARGRTYAALGSGVAVVAPGPRC